MSSSEAAGLGLPLTPLTHSLLDVGYISIWNTGPWDRYKDAFFFSCHRHRILSSKYDHWKKYCQPFNEVSQETRPGMFQEDKANRRGSENVTLISGASHRRRCPPRALVSVRGQVPASLQ